MALGPCLTSRIVMTVSAVPAPQLGLSDARAFGSSSINPQTPARPAAQTACSRRLGLGASCLCGGIRIASDSGEHNYRYGRAPRPGVAGVKTAESAPKSCTASVARIDSIWTSSAGSSAAFAYSLTRIQEQIGDDWRLEGVIKALLKERAFQTPVERSLSAMTANRALASSSRLHMEHWVAEKAYIEGLPEVQVQQPYRAMDFLLEAHDEIQHDVFFSVANCLRHRVGKQHA